MTMPADGRRIYIHREALGDMARQDRRQAFATSRALAEIRLAKIVHHHLVDNGVDIGAVRAATANIILPITVGTRQTGVTNFLRDVTYVPKLPWKEDARLPVLSPDEKVVDTCFQDGYYTFATGPGAAERMFEDRVPMPELKLSLAAGQGPGDLTIITSKGRMAKTGSTATSQSDAIAPSIDLAQVREIDVMSRNDTKWGVSAALAEVDYEVGGFTELEAMVMQGLTTAVERTFEASSY